LHDTGEKMVLGHRIKAGGGVEDGEQVLDILASHHATAHHIAFELTQRLVEEIGAAVAGGIRDEDELATAAVERSNIRPDL